MVWGGMNILRNDDIRIRLMIFVIGFAPIASLSLSAFGLVPLHVSGPLIVVPAAIGALIIGSTVPRYASTLLRGFLLGVSAVFLYDVTCRFPFMFAGLWPDFIPKIGNYLLHRDNVHWSVGYLWRYIGNGGGMGLAFYAIYPLLSARIKARAINVGVFYGITIFACALVTIYCSPAGRIYLFDPTLLTAIFGFMGHVVFGYVLGYGAKHYPDQVSLMPVHLHQPHSSMAQQITNTAGD